MWFGLDGSAGRLVGRLTSSFTAIVPLNEYKEGSEFRVTKMNAFSGTIADIARKNDSSVGGLCV